jgi:hypothetical protein
MCQTELKILIVHYGGESPECGAGAVMNHGCSSVWIVNGISGPSCLPFQLRHSSGINVRCVVFTGHEKKPTNRLKRDTHVPRSVN